MNREQRRAAARRARRIAAVGSAGALVASGAALVTGSLPAGAVAFEVSTLAPNGAGSLDQAIQDANGTAGPDTITFAPGLSGTITLTASLPEITEAVDIQGPGASVITIDGVNAFHPFEFEGTGASTISGLTVTRGEDDTGHNPDGSGGGIALYNDGSLTISNMVITENDAGNDGGGVWCNSAEDMTIIGSTISGNEAGAGGGALYTDECESLTIISSTISGNIAGSDGGGLYINYTDLVVRGSTISGNTADDGGGGAWLYNYDYTTVFQNSTISGNTANDEGGALYVPQGGVDLVQTTVTGNVADTTGGIYATDAGALSVKAKDLSEKTPEELAKPKKGRAQVGAQAGYDVNLAGAIVAGNSGFDLRGGGDEDGVISSLNSLLGTVDPATIVHDQGGTLTGVNPLLGPLAANGGPTLTHALLAGSPAINAGPVPVPTFPDNAFDQRGPGFARVSNGRVDIGAYEVQAPVVVPRFTG